MLLLRAKREIDVRESQSTTKIIELGEICFKEIASNARLDLFIMYSL